MGSPSLNLSLYIVRPSQLKLVPLKGPSIIHYHGPHTLYQNTIKIAQRYSAAVSLRWVYNFLSFAGVYTMLKRFICFIFYTVPLQKLVSNTFLNWKYTGVLVDNFLHIRIFVILNRNIKIYFRDFCVEIYIFTVGNKKKMFEYFQVIILFCSERYYTSVQLLKS